ncbi:hypothetical protein R6Q59_002517 [Mikania micrantha]
MKINSYCRTVADFIILEQHNFFDLHHRSSSSSSGRHQNRSTAISLSSSSIIIVFISLPSSSIVSVIQWTQQRDKLHHRGGRVNCQRVFPSQYVDDQYDIPNGFSCCGGGSDVGGGN